MKILCQVCEKTIDTEGTLKGNYAYGFTVHLESEPCINTAITRRRDGYLCYDCQQKLSNFLKYKRA